MKLYIWYWIIIVNWLISIIFILVWNCFNLYIVSIIRTKLYALSFFMIVIVILISSCVILNSIDYSSIMDSYPFIFYIILLNLCMLCFVLCHDIILSFLYWDLLGLFSYLLINFWSSKVNCGIKAVLFNKIGDNFSLFMVCWFYSELSFISYYPSLPINLLLPFSLYFFSSLEVNSINSFFIPAALAGIIFSKSAQLPFSTWLLNAIPAPTPIPALSHSSTMVIAGVILGIMIDDMIIVIIDYFSLILYFIILIPCNTLLWSLLKAISLCDIKSIIAYSTISQISYMFIALLINPLLSLYHITVHSLFKSLLFLLGGSLIHIENNYQNIYKMKTNYKLYCIIYILISNTLVLSISKETIIICIVLFISSPFSFSVLIVCAIFTTLYTLKIYFYCFVI